MNSKILYKDFQMDDRFSFKQLQLHLNSKIVVVVMDKYMESCFNLNEVYIATKRWFVEEGTLSKYEFPFVMVTSVQIKLINDYKLVIK